MDEFKIFDFEKGDIVEFKHRTKQSTHVQLVKDVNIVKRKIIVIDALGKETNLAPKEIVKKH